MRTTILLLPLIASLTWTPPAGASASENPDEAITVRGITSQATRTEVAKTVYAPWNEQLARWDHTFCPMVVGLPEPYLGVVLDHLKRSAQAVIPNLSTSCPRSNVFVVFTDDGTAALNRILAKAPMLGNTIDPVSIVTSGFEPPTKTDITELRRDRPVRWYHNTVIEPTLGVVMIWDPQMQRLTAQSKMKVSNLDKITQVRVNSVTIIVDAERATGAKLGQLADYIAFVSLTTPKLGETFDTISIMSLFNNDRFNAAAPAGLSRFDIAMLHALFAANPARQANDEQAEIALTLRQSLSDYRMQPTKINDTGFQ